MDMSVYAPCALHCLQDPTQLRKLQSLTHFQFFLNLQTNEESAAEICIFKLRAFVCLEYLHKNTVSSRHKYA